MAQVIKTASGVCPWCGWRFCNCIFERLANALSGMTESKVPSKGVMTYCYEGGIEESEVVTIH